MISKVVRDNRRHITRSDYNDQLVLLDSENVIFPQVGSLQSRALRRLLPAGRTLSHREFDFASHSYRLGGYIGFLRDKGWVIVDHDEIALTRDVVSRKAKFTRYEMFAVFSSELQKRIDEFCRAVDRFESEAAKAASE